MTEKKICVVVASRANYGRVKYLMKAIKEHPCLKLQLIVGASTLLERFGKAVDIIKQDGFTPDRSIYYVVEGENLATQAKSTGLGIVELSTAFQDLNPDMVVTVADRFETMATAIASSYLNIPLIHLQGGEVSGNIDDRVRHAITKLADYHFVATEESKNRVINMGESEERVFNHGCPAMDILANENLSIDQKLMESSIGVGMPIDWAKPYILMLQHPVTTSFGNGLFQITETLKALKNYTHIQKIILWPNADAGSDEISKGIRKFRENNSRDINFHFVKNFSPENYAKVLNNAMCAVGNSSSFLREGAFLGVPAIIVGDRQRNREHGCNIQFSDYNADMIIQKIAEQLEIGRYDSDKKFGHGQAGQNIAATLSETDIKLK